MEARVTARVLTDYHVHLRPDERRAHRAGAYFTAGNAERYREAAEEHGIAELGVAEHIHRFAQSLEVWQHPCWRQCARDDLDAYCGFVREETDLRLGIEADFVPGREDRIANLLEARDWDYVVGSVHFLRDDAARHATTARSGAAATRPRRSGGATSRRSAEAARSGLYDIIAHPDLVKVWGRERAAARRRPAPLLRAGRRGVRRGGRRRRGLDRRAAQAGRRALPGAAAPRDGASTPGCPIALSSDAHVPDQVGYRYEDALALLEELGRRRAVRVRAPRAAAGADRLSWHAAPGIGDRLARVRAGRAGWSSAASRSRTISGLAGHSDADVLAHAITDALLGAAGLGDIGQHFPDTDERWRGRRLDGAAARSSRAPRRLAIEHVDATVMIERPKLAPHRDAIRASLARPRSAARVNVKATTGEGMGFVGRGEGVAALAVATLLD